MKIRFSIVLPWLIAALLATLLVLLFIPSPGPRPRVPDVNYSDLLTKIEQDQVHDVYLRGKLVRGHFTDNAPS